MIRLSKKYKSTVIVNHSDLFNENLNYLLSKLKLIGKITFIEGDFGKFDNTYKRNNPFKFQIGLMKVIPGWEIGIIGMQIYSS